MMRSLREATSSSLHGFFDLYESDLQGMISRQVATMFEYIYIDKLWKYLEFCKTPQWDKTDTAFLQSHSRD